MKILNGIGASDGLAIEKIFYLKKEDLSVTEEGVSQVTELKRFIDAQNQAISELDILFEKARKSNEETAKIFEIHQMLISDPDFTEGVQEEIAKGKNAEYAVHVTALKFQEMFTAMDDEVMKARSADVTDIRNRLIRILKHGGERERSEEILEGKVILVGDELLPSEIMKIEIKSIAGFVSHVGSTTSHAVILARTLNLPIVIGVQEFSEIPETGILAINGRTGEVVINPNEEIIAHYEKMILEENEKRAELNKYRGKAAITRNNHRILVAANIGNVSDIDHVLENDADGVGLFRSEFLYLEANDYPDEETQFTAYREVVSRMKPKSVIIRTLDIGADKVADYFHLDPEDNPALGYRAIRICLNVPGIFRTQLRALLRASAFGSLSVMFPMITHAEQVTDIKEILKEIKAELRKNGLPFDEAMKIGVMIETPAAVMISDRLAKMVDFFSIGTNDLTQYTLACDRMNQKISYLFDYGHESIRRMIAMTAKNAHDAGIWVGICGESAGDLRLLDFYIENGIDELSVSPPKVLALKKAILER